MSETTLEIAKIRVNDTTGRCMYRRQIPAGLVGGTVRVIFEDPVWDNLTKTVVFRTFDSKIAEFDGTTAVIPWELLEQPGRRLYFGIWGSDPDSDLQLPLIEVPIGVVEEATDPNADPATAPTLPIWADLKNRVEDLEQNGTGGSGTPGQDGEDGGYYTPQVTQPSDDTVQFAFVPSKPDMPSVEPTKVKLPAGEGTADLTGYAKESWVQENYQPKGEYLTEVPDGYAKKEDIPTKPEDIGAQPAGDYALRSELPEVPVYSVNGKTGAVQLGAADVKARPDTWVPTAQEVGALPSTYVPPDQTAEQVGADPAGTAQAAVSQHNVSTDSHNDIRLELKAINDRLNAFFDTDDQTLDELSEIVAFIVTNKSLIDAITTSKVSVADIVNNLTTNVANRPLSAAQGVVLKGLIDTVSNSLSNYQPKGDYMERSELPAAIDTALAQAAESGEFDGPAGTDGKSAYAYAKEAGYAGTEEEFAEKLSLGLLTESTSGITPNQVYTAILNNQNVYILYIDRAWGVFAFNSFSVNVSLGVIFSSSILQYNGMYAVVELIGYLDTDNWEFIIQQIPIMSDIPTIPESLKNPYALTINGTSYDGSQAVNLTIEGGSSGDSIPSYIRTEAERVAKLVQSRQNANTITFLACGDTHYYSPDNATANANAEKMQEAVVSMGQAMGMIRQRVPIDFAVMFGDMVWDSGETKEEILSEMRFVNACLGEGFGAVPQLRMEGNHDDAYESGGDLTSGEIFPNIGAWNTGAVFGSREGNYCYRDFEDVKLRVIALNSSQYSGSAAQFNADQVTWLAKALDLSNKGADWRSVILSHHPLDWGRAGGTDPTAAINAASGLIASFHGHIHNFLTGTVTNTELPRIAIPNAGYSRENQYGESYGINWKEDTTYSKTPGTAENTSFCVVTIDLAAKKIYADHYGAGYDRIITYDDAVLSTFTVTNNLTNVISSNASAVVEEGKSYAATLTAAEGYELKTVSITMGGTDITSTAYSGGSISIASVTGNIVITATAAEIPTVKYTNLVPVSIGTDGAIYGDDYNADGTPDGYRNGKYASGAGEGTDAACVLTGLIAYGTNRADPIYIKGADVTTTSHCRIIAFNAAKEAAFQSAAGSAITTYFTVETLGTSYYKLTPISGSGIMSHTDYLRFSLIGTGTNLIITINEPIE